MNPTLLRQHFARWNPLHFDSAGSPGTFRGGRINERSEERKQSYSVQSKGVSQPRGVVMSKPRVQHRPSGKEGVHPFETTAPAAAMPRERKASKSFMMEIGIRRCRKAVVGEMKSRDEEASQLIYSDTVKEQCRR